MAQSIMVAVNDVDMTVSDSQNQILTFNNIENERIEEDEESTTTTSSSGAKVDMTDSPTTPNTENISIDNYEAGVATCQENGLSARPRRRPSILSKRASRPKVKKSVSFCSMPEDRRVSNGKRYFAYFDCIYHISSHHISHPYFISGKYHILICEAQDLFVLALERKFTIVALASRLAILGWNIRSKI